MPVREKLLVCVVGGLLLALVGCAPSVVGVDSAAYYSGKLYAVSSRDITTVYNATQRALSELEIPVTEKAKDVFSARVKAKSADGKSIAVIIRPGKDGQTDYSIKVGAFGNKHRSNVIYERIQQNLGIRGK